MINKLLENKCMQYLDKLLKEKVRGYSTIKIPKEVSMTGDIFFERLLNSVISLKNSSTTYELSEDVLKKYWQCYKDNLLLASTADECLQNYEDYADSILDEISIVEKSIAALKELRQSYIDFINYAKDIKRICVHDWNKHLSDPNEFDRYEFALLIQAVDFNELMHSYYSDYRSVSLFTNELTKLYKGRKIGLVYQLDADSLIGMSTENSNCSVTHVSTQESIDNSLADFMFDETTHTYTFLEDDAFYSFKDFVKKSDPGKANEIYLGKGAKVIGIFRYCDIPLELQKQVDAFAKYLNLPVLVYDSEHNKFC